MTDARAEPGHIQQIGDRRAFVFDEGLIGCPDWKHFVLETEAVGPAIHLLRCLDDEDACLYLTDPFTILPDYEFDLSDAEVTTLDISEPAEALVLVVLTVRDDPPSVTANMLGPLVVNVRTGRGRQLVLAATDYSVRHPVG